MGWEIVNAFIIFGIPFFFIFILLASLISNKSFLISRQGSGIAMITGHGVLLLTTIKFALLYYTLAKYNFLYHILNSKVSLLILSILLALGIVIITNILLNRAYKISKRPQKIDKILSGSYLIFGVIDVFVFIVALQFLNLFLSNSFNL